MKPIDVTSDSYGEYNEDSSKKIPKIKVGDHVRISKYKNIFAKGYAPNWSEEGFVVSKIKNTVPWTSQEKFRIENVFKRKSDKLYVKWTGYDSHFNSGIDKKDFI